jgi:hypothetical protein
VRYKSFATIETYVEDLVEGVNCYTIVPSEGYIEGYDMPSQVVIVGHFVVSCILVNSLRLFADSDSLLVHGHIYIVFQ